jgi:hypothetical protein
MQGSVQCLIGIDDFGVDMIVLEYAMAISATGPVTMSEILTKLSASPLVSSLYGTATGVPLSGELRISQFLGKSSVFAPQSPWTSVSSQLVMLYLYLRDPLQQLYFQTGRVGLTAAIDVFVGESDGLVCFIQDSGFVRMNIGSFQGEYVTINSATPPMVAKSTSTDTNGIWDVQSATSITTTGSGSCTRPGPGP